MFPQESLSSFVIDTFSRICDGQKIPDDVLTEQVVKYKEVFIEAARKVCDIHFS